MPSIFDWDSSYYINSTKCWIYGKLFLYNNCIKFIETKEKNNAEEELVKVVVKLSSINNLKKSTSSFVYSCIVLYVESEALWFSSLKNRDHVFNTIEHFRKDLLFGNNISQKDRPSDDLMRIVYNTQDTLVEAANTLHHQGRQLSNASRLVNSMNQNLTVAERLTDDLDSWFGSWRVKPPMKPHTGIPNRIDSPLANDRIEYQVLIAKIKQESHKDGYVIFKKDIIDILNEKSIILFTFKVNEISEINIHSPWDLTLVNRQMGNADISVHLISTRMSSIINTLKDVYKQELSFDRIPEGNQVADHLNDNIDMGFSISDKISEDPSSKNKLILPSNTSKLLSKQAQKTLSDEDATQISTVLQNLKQIATDIGVEQDAQIDQLDSLNHSIDRAESRIISTNVRIKKLM